MDVQDHQYAQEPLDALESPDRLPEARSMQSNWKIADRK
jgi:hypothetical protein